jgi:hypothetical protein
LPPPEQPEMRTNVDIKKSRLTEDKGLATMRCAPKLRPEGRRRLYFKAGAGNGEMPGLEYITS